MNKLVDINVIATIMEVKEPEEAFEFGKKVAQAGLLNVFNFEADGSTYTIFSKQPMKDVIGITEDSLDDHPQKYGVSDVDNEDTTVRELLFLAIEQDLPAIFGNKHLVIEYI